MHTWTFPRESSKRTHCQGIKVRIWQCFYLHRVRGNIMCIANFLHVGIPSVAFSVINQPRVYRGLHIDKFWLIVRKLKCDKRWCWMWRAGWTSRCGSPGVWWIRRDRPRPTCIGRIHHLSDACVSCLIKTNILTDVESFSSRPDSGTVITRGEI